MQESNTENINDYFFDGYYKEIWRGLIPDGLSKAEVDFLVERSNLQVGDRVLDLMCGYGRHAIALARRSIHVTAIDNLRDYVDEVKEIADKENLPVQCIHDNVSGYEPSEMFDLVICLGNNLSFFDKEECENFFSMIARHTKRGKLFIANSWTIAEIVFKNFNAKSWSQVNDVKYLVDSKIFFNPTRVETNMTMIPKQGAEETKKAIDYVYSLNEIEAALDETGFEIKELWAIPGKKKFSLGEPRVYIVAEKK